MSSFNMNKLQAPVAQGKTPVTSLTKLNTLLDSMRAKGARKADSSPVGRAPSGPASAGSAHVYYRSGDEKVYLGTISNKDKLILFSRTASDQLVKANFDANKMVYVLNVRAVVVNKVDDNAGRIVFNWINLNDMKSPSPLTFAHLGHKNTFLDGCKLHHAAHQFHLDRDLRGEDIRERIFWHIRGIKKVTIQDFQAVLEWLTFDAGLVKEMMRKVAYHTLKGWIPDAELDALFAMCQELDLAKGSKIVEQMVEIEAEVSAQIDATMAKREKEAALDRLVVTHESVAGKIKASKKQKRKAMAKAMEGNNAEVITAAQGGDKGKGKAEELNVVEQGTASTSQPSRISYANILQS
ncbi:hypothetical protein Q7P37_002319 [Cladosporium fusiforme]